MKTITITVQGLLTPQGVANALTKTAAGILGNGETLQQPLGAGAVPAGSTPPTNSTSTRKSICWREEETKIPTDPIIIIVNGICYW